MILQEIRVAIQGIGTFFLKIRRTGFFFQGESDSEEAKRRRRKKEKKMKKEKKQKKHKKHKHKKARDDEVQSKVILISAFECIKVD